MPTSARFPRCVSRADVGIGPYDRYQKVFDKSKTVYVIRNTTAAYRRSQAPPWQDFCAVRQFSVVPIIAQMFAFVNPPWQCPKPAAALREFRLPAKSAFSASVGEALKKEKRKALPEQTHTGGCGWPQAKPSPSVSVSISISISFSFSFSFSVCFRFVFSLFLLCLPACSLPFSCP